MAPLVCARALGFSYENQPVLHNFNLSIEEGSFVALLGHNGSGKSTLARLLGGVLRPSEGSVTVAGIDSADDLQTDLFRETVGMVFQNPDNQLVSSIVEEDVAFAPENLGIPNPRLSEIVAESLEAVGMSEYRLHSTSLLSGGQKQRVAIAGALAMSPRLLILDEPTAMLDPAGRESVLRVIHRLHRERGMTVVLITHHMEEAAEADRVIVLNRGSILLDGTPREVFQNAGLLQSVGLCVPQTVELMFLLRRAGVRAPLSVLTPEECVPVVERLWKEGFDEA